MKMRLITSSLLCPLMLIVSVAGCRHLEPAGEVPEVVEATEEALAPVSELFEAEQYGEALIAWIDAMQGVTPSPAALDLRTRILRSLRDEAARQGAIDREDANEALGVEAVRKEALPATYGAVRYQSRALKSHTSPSGPMREVLDRKVTMHLSDADLPTIIAVLGKDKNTNIVADRGLGAGKKLDMQLDDVPLGEVLDYISRNFGIQFYVGENMIWATPADAKQTGPMETRIYRLHKGLQFHNSNWTINSAATRKKGGANPINRNDLSFMATEIASESTYLEELIKSFVPVVEEAQFLFDKNTHTLFVRNTLGNLALIEKLVEAVDVSPPQVLIEARFIEASVDDLQEIGIDWVLDEPWVMSHKQVLEDGVAEEKVAAQLTGAGAGGLAFSAPERELNTDVNERSLESYGLNLTYQGILTQPMFTAVLHALEVSGKGRTLSVPRVTTVNNNPAKLRNGQDLLYYEEFQAQAFSLLDENGKKYSVTALMPKGAPVLAELGITLIAVPSVGQDGSSISLLLTPTISQLDDFNFYTRQRDSSNTLQQVEVKLPTISRREVQTKVVVQSGETVAMGGLIEVVSTDREHRVPLLGHLPLIGQLFRRVDTVEQRRNLLIFVTATVISERGESLIPSAAAGE